MAAFRRSPPPRIREPASILCCVAIAVCVCPTALWLDWRWGILYHLLCAQQKGCPFVNKSYYVVELLRRCIVSHNVARRWQKCAGIVYPSQNSYMFGTYASLWQEYITLFNFNLIIFQIGMPYDNNNVDIRFFHPLQTSLVKNGAMYICPGLPSPRDCRRCRANEKSQMFDGGYLRNLIENYSVSCCCCCCCCC